MRSANLKKAVWGLMAFASTLVCVMDCYPLIPAVYGVYCLSSGHTIIFYIGLIIMWALSFGLDERIFGVLVINALIDLIFLGAFL